jgi:hypothetical protein
MQHLVEKTQPDHKIWSWWGILRWVGALVGLGVILGIYGGLNVRQNPGLVQAEGYYYVDADCYSRMTRVRMLEEGAGPILTWHEFENYPEGLKPHTTALMDWVILGWHELCGREVGELDRSGYEISPILGGVWLVLVWWWSGWLRLPYRWGVLVLLACSPAMLHAFAAGRPDHQSLVVLFCGAGLLVETLGMAEPQRRIWEWLSGLVWGLALWVSWFEPGILLLLVWAVRGGRIVLANWRGRGGDLPFASGRSYGLAVGLALGVMVLEGVPQVGLPPELRESFFLWSASIGELQRVNPWALLARWVGWSAWLVLPALLAGLYFRRNSEGAGALIFWLVLWVALAALTAWHIRWGYFLVLVSILALPWAWGWLRWRCWGYVVLGVGLWPMAAELERTLFPEGAALAQRVDQIQEMRELRAAAAILREKVPGGLLAPWWQTPSLVYWSGQPGVGGSSHQSLPGNLLAAEVFLAASPEEIEAARKALRARQVRSILVGDSRRILAQAVMLSPGRKINGADGVRPLGEILDRSPRLAPEWLQPIYLTPTVKIYRVEE